MHINKLTDDYAVCAQIQAADLAAIKAAGYRSVICNRPDGEEFGQPPVAEIAAAAKAEGLPFYHVPIISGRMTLDDVQAMAAALAEAPAPVLAFCRSGARSGNIWQAVQEIAP